ncbi:MAG: hypothetical protein K9L59_17270 [Desulfobacterales bacterium]|nr:hypothetical protein [Desulfobacterales bacterium]
MREIRKTAIVGAGALGGMYAARFFDSEERLAAAYGWDRTLCCVALGMDPFRENNRIRVHREGRLLFGEAETIAVARAKGIDLTEKDIGKWHEVMAGLSPEGKTSMLQDLDAGRRTEVDMFAGTLVAMAEELGVDAPVNRTLLWIIRVLEEKADPG